MRPQPTVSRRRSPIQPLTWLACCGPKHNHLWFVLYASDGRNARIASNGQRVAWAQNVYPAERLTHIAALRSEGVLVGEFPTYEAAFAAACAELVARSPVLKPSAAA
jgi:hypothetical protein